jgi:hypothetical protein
VRGRAGQRLALPLVVEPRHHNPEYSLYRLRADNAGVDCLIAGVTQQEDTPFGNNNLFEGRGLALQPWLLQGLS